MAEQALSSETSSQRPLQQEQHQPENIQEHLLYKNRLQEFTQRAKIPLPVYKTISEGGPRHAPQFRSTVVVDGKTFTSLTTFSNRKAAEQDVAKIALEGISRSIKDCISSKTGDEGFPPIYEDRVFCKSILHEFAVKMNLEKPTYNTVRVEGLVPVFVSSLDFNGVHYTGEPSVTKKEAEQLAARAVILSILGNCGAATSLSEIIKSKAELFSAVHKRSCSDVDTGVSPMGLNSGTDYGAATRKEIVPVDAKQTGGVIENAVTQAVPRQSPDVPGHEFRKPIAETVSQPIWLPITFVPSSQGQPSLHELTCGEKRKCKRKKRANKKVKSELSEMSPLQKCDNQIGMAGV